MTRWSRSGWSLSVRSSSAFPVWSATCRYRLGKPVDLVIEGARTSADKTVVEALFEPLLHLVRNSLDHGVEPPEERRRHGKPERATVTLRAFHSNDRIVVEVADDGRRHRHRGGRAEGRARTACWTRNSLRR